MTRHPSSRESGMTLLEIMVSLVLISVVALAGGATVRALGLMGVVQYSGPRYERPARVRTLAMEYIQAEMEYLQNWPYEQFRDAAACTPSGGLPTPFSTARRVPATYLNADEPRLPAQLAAADILIASEPVVSPGTPPSDCRPRRVTITVYLQPGDAPATPGGAGGTMFIRGETARAPR